MIRIVINAVVLIVLLIWAPIFNQNAVSQDVHYHQIGIYRSIYIKDNLLSLQAEYNLLALRYSYNLTSNFFLGFEISGNYTIYKNSLEEYNSKMYNGLFLRYNVYNSKKCNIFTEFSPQLMYTLFKPGSNPAYKNSPEKKIFNYTYYGATGLSAMIYNDRAKIDFIFKVSPDEFINEKNYFFTFRLNVVLNNLLN